MFRIVEGGTAGLGTSSARNAVKTPPSNSSSSTPVGGSEVSSPEVTKYARFDRSNRAALTEVENDSCRVSAARIKKSLPLLVVLIHRGVPALYKGSSRSEQYSSSKLKTVLF